MSEGEQAEEFDPAARDLCPDGGCVGVIGDDGRCRVCGRASEGSPVGERAPASADSDGDEPDDEIEAEADDAPGGLTVEGDIDDRKLCPDGGCVGLIGDDGRCKVCGLAEDATV